jgi:membrane-bound serine protease (ClpP class)
VDGIAATIEEVLADADGREVEVYGTGPVTLDVDGAAVTDVSMNPVMSFLHLLSDPNVAFILFVAGALLLATELVSTNLVTGVLGALALVLAFIGFGSLPLNVVGLLLVALGFVLFILESQIVSHGLLTVAGLVCVVLGASVLYTGPVSPSDPVVQVAPAILVTTACTLGLLMGLITIVAIRTRRMRGPAGQMGDRVPQGTEGVVQAPLAPTGTVYLAGETWTARTPDGSELPRETPVRLLGFDELTALVEPTGQPPAYPDTRTSRDPITAVRAADKP